MDPYDQYAARFFNQYQQLAFEDVHQSWLHYLPDPDGSALDVGAGSGRDAAALAKRGWNVLAVEPASALRQLGQEATEGLSVNWLGDSVPALSKVCASGERFKLILVSAVWMHLPVSEREQAFQRLSQLMAPAGILVITLRHGHGDGERTFYETSRQELEELAQKMMLTQLPASDADGTDRLGRNEVWWETLIFHRPN